MPSSQYIVNVIQNRNNRNGMLEMEIADGVIIVVDSDRNWNAISMQTFIENAINEKLKIILFVNNVDVNLLTVTEAYLETIYHELEAIIQSTARLIQQSSIEELYCVEVMTNVVFGSIEKGWAFTLDSFASVYSASFSKFDSKTLAQKLWGDRFYSFTVSVFDHSTNLT